LEVLKQILAAVLGNNRCLMGSHRTSP